MNNTQALLARSPLLADLPAEIINSNLNLQGVEPGDEFTPDDTKAIDLAYAALLLFIVSGYKSKSNLDYSVTMQDAASLLAIRSSILRQYGIADTHAGNSVKGFNW